jgi:catechol 2,3-dioxygenase-like lactoylglutathione lyase family enzyme
MTYLSFDHAAIPIADVAASRTFYEDVLGLSLHDAMSGGDWGGHPWLLMFYRLNDGRLLALAHFDGARHEHEKGLPADGRHYALATPDLAPWRERLAGHGIEPVEEDHGPQRSLFIRAPEGTAWEITSPGSAAAHEAGRHPAAVVKAYLDGRARSPQA